MGKSLTSLSSRRFGLRSFLCMAVGHFCTKIHYNQNAADKGVSDSLNILSYIILTLGLATHVPFLLYELGLRGPEGSQDVIGAIFLGLPILCLSTVLSLISYFSKKSISKLIPAILSGLIIFTWVLFFAVEFLPDIKINELFPTIFYGGLFLTAWIIPVALGIKSAKKKGISPHWMWFGIYPITAWIAFLLIRLQDE